jgi:hypothetical protein
LRSPLSNNLKEIQMKNRTTIAVAVLILMAAVALIPVGRAFAQTCGATVLVTPSNLNGWTTSEVPGLTDVDFVSGPATPPIGVGSAQLSIATTPGAGDEAAQLRNPNYAGTKISDLTTLSYSTYVQQYGSGGQAPYIILQVDNDGNGSVDDLLFFEPVYQDATFFPSNPQQSLALNTWQTWDALNGGWWSLNGIAGATPGTGVKSLDDYLAAAPNATIVNSASGAGGVRIVAGFGEGAWNGFVGNVDAFTIGASSCNTTFNFEPQVGPPANANQCKNGGWKTFNTPHTFKNQGDCIQAANTGK